MSVATDKELIQGLLRATESPRDALPYTNEFDELHRQYRVSTAQQISEHEFWRKLSGAAKQGGGRKKKRGQAPPTLTHQQLDKLRRLVTEKLGSRDSLPYTDEFDRVHLEFNTITKQNLTKHQLWRTIGNLGKRSTSPIVTSLFKQGVDSLVLGIEHFNRPSDIGRLASVLIMLDHAAEMLLKAALADRGDSLRNPRNGYTHSVEHCLVLANEDPTLRFLSNDERRTIQVLNALRDQAQHFIVEITEELLYTVSQGIVTLFADLLPRLFAQNLCSLIPSRVLPISTSPPKAIEVLMDDAFSQLKEMLQAGRNDARAVEPKLRSLLAIDRALNLQSSQVSDEDFQAAVAQVQFGNRWEEIFMGISMVKLTTDGSGASIALRISKNEGVPVRIVKDGEDPDAVVVLKNVSDTDRYPHSPTKLAQRFGMTVPKMNALVNFLKLKSDPLFFKQITVRNASFPSYSGEAVKKIKDELPRCNMEFIWQTHGPRVRKSK
ncbi:DUF3644 domain-containing protein [Rosistilla oblonga]|uniref:DUF3644 domain-containing protein n=1 Tax=Rosistilla oblonga TaxID=2527990 RepID=UPI003A97A124